MPQVSAFAPQAKHVAPWMPHDAVERVRQAPPWQQPVGQLVASQPQRPFTHRWPLGHGELAPHMQTPLVQTFEVMPHETQAPPLMLHVDSPALRQPPAAEQHPEGHVEALQLEPPPAPPAVEPPAVEPPAVEPPAVEPPAVEPPAVEPPAVEPPAVEPPAVEPPAVEPPAVEPPAVEPPAVEPPAVEPPAVEPPAVEPPAAEPPPLAPPAVDPPPALPPNPPPLPPMINAHAPAWHC